MVATHDEWFVKLDEPTRADARRCLVSGNYSRRLLTSLRQDGPPPAPVGRAGLDDPHRAQPGDPLGARLQTFLRERFLTPRAPAADGLGGWEPRWVDGDTQPVLPERRPRTSGSRT